MLGIDWPTVWPFRRLRDVSELKRLHQRLGRPNRWWVPTPDGVRLETDTEYLDRLRQLAHEWREPQ